MVLVLVASSGSAARAQGPDPHCDETDALLVAEVGVWGFFVEDLGGNSRVTRAMASCQARLYDGNDEYDDDGNWVREIPHVICERDVFTLGIFQWAWVDWYLEAITDDVTLRLPDGSWHDVELTVGGTQTPPPQWFGDAILEHRVLKLGPLSPGTYRWRHVELAPAAPEIGEVGWSEVNDGELIVLPHDQAHGLLGGKR